MKGLLRNLQQFIGSGWRRVAFSFFLVMGLGLWLSLQSCGSISRSAGSPEPEAAPANKKEGVDPEGGLEILNKEKKKEEPVDPNDKDRK